MNPMTPIIWAGSILATTILLALAYAVIAGTVKAIRRQRGTTVVPQGPRSEDETRTG